PAHRLRRLLVHGDDLVGVADFADALRQPGPGELVAQRGLVAMQQEADSRAVVTLEVILDAPDHDGRAVIPAHGVERNQYGGRQAVSTPSRPRQGAPVSSDDTVASGGCNRA